MLDAVIETSQMTQRTIEAIFQTMAETKHKIRGLRFYSKDLLDALFLFPYTRIRRVQKMLGISRNTATQRLKTLVELGVLQRKQLGRNVYFINGVLFAVLNSIPDSRDVTTETIVTSHHGLRHG